MCPPPLLQRPTTMAALTDHLKPYHCCSAYLERGTLPAEIAAAYHKGSTVTLFPVCDCSAYLDAEVDVDDPDRPVYLLGESFGAVLALAVAAAKNNLVDRLVLVNPATSYENSIWPRLGPALAKLPDVCPCCHSQHTHARLHPCTTKDSTGLIACQLWRLCGLVENVFHQIL